VFDLYRTITRRTLHPSRLSLLFLDQKETMTYYAVLGVNRDATQSDIKKAYRRKVLTHHPDKGGSKEDFQELKEAYDTLKDMELRAQYDYTLENPISQQETWAQAQAQAHAYAQWQYEQQYHAFRQMYEHLEQVASQWQFGQHQVWEPQWQQQTTAQCEWTAQQNEEQMRHKLERAIQLEKLREQQARQEEQRQQQLLKRLEEVARLERELQEQIRKNTQAREEQEKLDREIREEQVRQEKELQKRQQEAKENRQREETEQPCKKLQGQPISRKEHQQKQQPQQVPSGSVTFGITKSGAPCKSCIQQGRYCTRHLHQGPLATAKVSKGETVRKNRAFGVDISNGRV